MINLPCYNSKTQLLSTLPIIIHGLMSVPLFLPRQNLGQMEQIVASGMESRATCLAT